MTAARRHAYLARLGLVAWQPRPDVHFALAAQPAEPTAATPAEEAVTPAGSALPADADSAAGDMVGAAEAGQLQQPQSEQEPAWVDEPGAPSDAEDQVAPVAPSIVPPAEDVTGLDWEQLQAWLAQRDTRGARQPVFGTGAREADLLIVGEAPGAQEDRQGQPFVGPAGQLLDRMLAAIGCSRERDVYITNICKFRPPNNRDPHADEVAADWPVLERQIELMNPKLVVAVGRVAGQTLLDSTASLRDMRARLHRYPRRDLPVVVTYHPAYLLRSPPEKAKSWQDLRHVAALLRGADDAGKWA